MVVDLRKRATTFVVTAVVLAASLLWATGCSADAQPDPQDSGSGGSSAPGVYELQDGSSRIVGVVVFRDLEGGFWAIADTGTATQGEAAANLAILIPPNGGTVTDVQFAEAEGHLVAAEGTLSDGPSIYMAGPMLEVDTLEILGAGE